MSLRALWDVPAPAKLNLFLHVVGRRADGYHLLQSLMVPIDWCDTLHFERRDDGRLARHDLGDPLPEDDLCLRAARALQRASGTALGCDLSIEKRLPSGAGLGGGSSDAATTLIALNRLWGLGWPRERLMSIGLAIGADVPFFLGRGPALVEGIGERLTPVDVPPTRFAVVKPAASIETRALFASPLLVRDSPPLARTAILAGSPAKTLSFTRSDLQAAAEAQEGDIAEASRRLRAAFGNSRMTGSGSAVFSVMGAGVDPEADDQTQGDAKPIVASDTGVLQNLPMGWTGRMCKSFAAHPLHDWLID